MPVQRLKVAILPPDFPCSGPVTPSGKILTTGKSHGKAYVHKVISHVTVSLQKNMDQKCPQAYKFQKGGKILSIL
jgi:hypothetical protein